MISRIIKGLCIVVIIIIGIFKFSSTAYAEVLFYKDGLSYGIIYDEAGNDTGKVEVQFPECNQIFVGPEGESEPNIIVPDSIEIDGDIYQVTRVADGGFYELLSLESITLPASITEIGSEAFYDCSNLSDIIAECASINVGFNAFAGTAWMDLQQDDFVIFNDTLVKYNGNDSNVIIPSNIKTIGICAFIVNENLKSVTIPDSVEKIGENAFDTCNKLTSVNIPGSIKEIDMSAFSSCSKLNKINFSEGLKIIGEHAFSDTNVSSVIFPKSLEIIGDFAFSGCGKLVNVEFNNGLKEIGACAFDYTSIKKLTIPKSVGTIHSGAFSSCESLTSVILSDGVKTIDSAAFRECKKLKNIVIPSSVSFISYDAFMDTAFEKTLTDEFCIINHMLIKYNGNSKTVKIPKGVTKILCTFENNHNMEAIIFPSSLNEIGAGAFMSCGLDEITIPSSVKKIGYGAFSACGLKKVNIENGLREIDQEAFSSNELTTVTIPKSVVSIAQGAFSYNQKLTSVKFSEGLEFIGKWAFMGCNLKEFLLPSTVKLVVSEPLWGGNENLTTVRFSKSMKTVPYLSRDNMETVTKVILPEGIRSVGQLMIFPRLRKVELPKTLLTIETSAFHETNIDSIYIPEGTNYIGYGAFSDCVRLKEVSIPDSVKYIRRGCFWGSENVVFRCNKNSVAYEFAMEAGIKVIGPYVKK